MKRAIHYCLCSYYEMIVTIGDYETVTELSTTSLLLSYKTESAAVGAVWTIRLLHHFQDGIQSLEAVAPSP